MFMCFCDEEAENQTDDLENHVRRKKLRLFGLWDGAEDQQLHPNTSKAKPTQVSLSDSWTSKIGSLFSTPQNNLTSSSSKWIVTF